MFNHKITGIIFDYDGVIANSDQFHITALKYAAKTLDLNFIEAYYKKFFSGKTLVDGSKSFLTHLNQIEKLEKFIELKRSQDYLYKDKVIPYTKTLDFLLKNKSKFRYSIASGTRKNIINIFLSKYDLNNIFEFVLTSEDYTKGKPDPECYNLAAKTMNIPKENLIIIEDAPLGIQAAKNADIKCIALEHTHTYVELSEADLIVKDLSVLKL